MSGMSVNGLTPTATVNGEAAKSGRSIFSSSSVTTPENASATIYMGSAGAIELMSGTSVIVSFDRGSASIDLTAGTLRIVNSGQPMTVNAAGKVNKMSAGESATAGGARDDRDYRDANGKCVDANKNGKEECDAPPSALWLWALVIGGATAGVVVGVAAANSNDNNLGGAGNVVSPTR